MDKMIGAKKVIRSWGELRNKRKQKRREQRQVKEEIDDSVGQFDLHPSTPNGWLIDGVQINDVMIPLSNGDLIGESSG